jgi:iron complex transport system ATP-binding protein
VTAALRATGLAVSLGGREVLAGVDVTLAAGRWTAVVGPNGAGKSTLLRALAGVVPHRGAVMLRDRPREAWPARERARTLAWLGQAESGGEDLRVWDLVMLGRLPHQGWLAAPSAADRAAVTEALHATQAWAWRERTLGSLSGGERQRVRLARLLAVQAPVLLMDEPLANLDVPHQADWLALVRGLAAQGRTVVSVLHEVGMALQADAVLVMQSGRVVHHGPPADAATRAAVRTVFDDRLDIHPVAGAWVVVPRTASPGFPPRAAPTMPGFTPPHDSPGEHA